MSYCNKCGRKAVVVLSVVPGWGENAFCEEHNPENPLRPLYAKAALWDEALPLLRFLDTQLRQWGEIPSGSEPHGLIRALLARAEEAER